MARKVYHVVPAGEGDWMVMEEGGEQPVAACADKEECISHARSLAKDGDLGQVIVHDRQGRFQTEYTYGEDPPDKEG